MGVAWIECVFCWEENLGIFLLSFIIFSLSLFTGVLFVLLFVGLRAMSMMVGNPLRTIRKNGKFGNGALSSWAGAVGSIELAARRELLLQSASVRCQRLTAGRLVPEHSLPPVIFKPCNYPGKHGQPGCRPRYPFETSPSSWPSRCRRKIRQMGRGK